MNITIVGATGNVGRKIIEILEKKNFPIDALYLVASSKSAGSKLRFKEKEIEVENLETFDFSKGEITFFSAGGKISEKYAAKAAKHSTVIDNSSYFRMDPDVPLIVPEVNPNDLKNHKKKNIVANANCSVIPLVVALKPLHDLYNIKRIVASTYQSVSGAGKAPMDELLSQTKDFFDTKELRSNYFTKQIAFNAIPHIDNFLDSGYTKEEQKMHDEVKKILDSKIKVTSTSVRIPVLVSHAVSVNVEFNKKYKFNEIKNVLNTSPGCKVIDEHKDGGYITPAEAENKFDTFISRVREDNSQSNTINLWIVSDNLLKGAALNAVEIAEILIKNK
ncbi:MAG: aspartate-semialdehyde dehydrogenase [Candidatus Pelagibacterales bacterium]|nr:MAG: aspartate-semialdehyde dehydrogenase [Pelagibacterales bacterium]|tara:strand:+ start:2197 stop:3195 length:999 start_codon:yes stop_codon:yes gene_type:complete